MAASANRMGFAGRTGASSNPPSTGANSPRPAAPRTAPPRGATSAGTRSAPKRSNDPSAPMRRRDTSKDRYQNSDYDSAPAASLAVDSQTEGVPAASPSSHSPRSRQPAAAPVAVNINEADHEGTLRLSKRMSELGLCSRREADEWIEHGWVSVDGVVIDTLGTRIRPDQTIEILPAAHADQQDRVTILLNKPIGYVSGQPEDGYPSAATLIGKDTRWAEDPNPRAITQAFHAGLAPAGRLDIDSTGLLVLTQDGRIAKQLIGEHSSIDKEYLVRVRFDGHEQDISKRFPAERLALLREGLSLDDKALKPARVDWLNGEQLRFILREGKKRQIRRMCELVGLEVIGLKRVRIGRVALGALPPGSWRYLAPGEFF
ncbi:MAG: pseudouridine synthase [Janthinobacterium lividum]